MNRRQQELLDEVVAAGGRLWVETTMTFKRKSGAYHASGYARMNAAHSLCSETDVSYCPGGFKRDVRLRLIEQQEVTRYPRTDPKVGQINHTRVLVELI